MRNYARFVVALLALSTMSVAQFRLKTRTAAELYAEQRRIVGTWCRQDFEGVRLTNAGWDRFKPLTNLKSNPDFSSILIVSRYQFEPRDTASWDVVVVYTVIGRYDLGAGYVPDVGTQTVTFQTKEIDGEITITNLDPATPLVSRKAAVDWMKKELASTTSDVEKVHLRDALKRLDPSALTAPEPTN